VASLAAAVTTNDRAGFGVAPTLQATNHNVFIALGRIVYAHDERNEHNEPSPSVRPGVLYTPAANTTNHRIIAGDDRDAVPTRGTPTRRDRFVYDAPAVRRRNREVTPMNDKELLETIKRAAAADSRRNQ
jgi:hypothetical protein